MSIIEKGSFVQFHFDLYTEDNTLIASSRDAQPYVYVHGIMETEPPGLGERLVGKPVGFEGDIVLPPEEAYGKRPPDEEAIKVLPLADLQRDLPEGMTLQKGLMFQSEFTMPNHQKGQVLCSVVDIRGDDVILYLGNPLAGQTVRFNITITEVREATEEDIRLLAQQHQTQ